ncbi:MAG: asparaginase domain-containing protein [Chloroflexi bacterium]|nr:asparaginase domain-containing protein [Chloroflexota bacterium]
MAKPRIAVFSGPTSTIANSPTLVTSNKGRIPGDRMLAGRFDHLIAQLLYEPVRVKIKKFSAHPLEEEAKATYHDDGKDYYEVELRPEDGSYLLPYMARRADGSPFEESDLMNAAIGFGGRQFFFPDASRIFADIDRSIPGRDEDGEANILDRQADFDFVRALPPAGYPQRGEVSGEDYFPYKPFPVYMRPRYRDLATVANTVQSTLASGKYAGGIWLEGSPTVEETSYWLSLIVDTDLPIAGIASQRTHGQLANDGDRNIVDAVSYVLSGRGSGLGAVGVMDERIYAAREFKKADDRPGNYKATGGHGGILGNVGPPVTIWYKPAYKHTSESDVNLSRLPEWVEFPDVAGDATPARVQVKNVDGTLRWESIPRVHIVKYGAYMDEDSSHNPDHEVDILARIQRGLEQERSTNAGASPFHGFVFEGTSPYGTGSGSQDTALAIAAFSGMPVVRVGRADPGGPIPLGRSPWTIGGSNLDTNKARLLLIASMLKLGRLPKAKDPRNPTPAERKAVIARTGEFQRIFDTH